MQRFRPLAPIFILLAAALPAFADCDHKADRSLSDSLDGIERVELHAAAGDLEVEAGGPTLEVRGEACASKAKLLEDIQIATKRSGKVLRIKVETPKTSGWSSHASLDLRLTLPADMPIEITDGSGDIEVRGVTLVDLDDGSGDSRLIDTRGDLRINDGSGGVTLRDHRGDVELKDGSGDLRLRGVEGQVLIASDGSGDINIENVTGDVDVRSDGSGDIDVERVSGNFHVGSAGSGDVHHRDIAGSVDIPRERR